MGHHDERNPFVLVQLHQQFAQGLGRATVEGAGRFVGQQQPRLVDQGPNYRHPLSFATRQLARSMPSATAQAHLVQQPPSTIRRLGTVGVAASSQRRHQHILQHRALRKQMMRLKDESEAAVAHRREPDLVQPGQILAFEPHVAPGGLVQCAHQVQQRALATPGRSHNRHRVARRQLEVDLLQDPQRFGPRRGRILFVNLHQSEDRLFHAAYRSASCPRRKPPIPINPNWRR